MAQNERTPPKDATDGAQLLSVRQAAEALATSERTIWRLLGQGELTKVQVGRSVRITRGSVTAFIARGGAK